MTYHNAKIRSAMTAIAAVLVLSSTPLFAQDALAPDPAPEPVSEPVTPAPDPLAPEPTAAEPAAATVTASPPAKASKPAARAKVATARPAPVPRATVTRSSAATTTAPAATAAPAATEAIEAPAATPVEAAPAPARAPADTASLAEAQQMDTLLEVGGAGLLALLIGGMALRSRKRRKEEQRIEEAKWAYIEDHPEPEAEVVREPSFARAPAPMHDPIPATSAALAGAPATKLPSGFDLSRFGPHVQAAYRGPTPDNPSLSLKYRLRRASALDQQERRAANQPAKRPAAPVPAKPAWAARREPQFMLRRAETDRAGANNGAKPAFQR
jgi:hypothetical protein